MNIDTKLTRLLGIKYPIIQGGMVWTSGADLASAVSNAGGLGVLGAGSMYPEQLREAIINCKVKTTLPFGVNIPLMYPNIEEHITTVIEHNVPVVVTSAGNPNLFTKRLRSHGIKVLHVVSSLKFALKAEQAEVDGIIAEGFEAGGHNGREENTTLVLLQLLHRHPFKIPVVAAGGIATGSAMLACFHMGASGVQMGSRFLMTKESTAHQNFKDLVKSLGEGDTILSLKELAPVRLIKNEFYVSIVELYQKGASTEELSSLLGRGRAKKGIYEGDLVEGELEIGQISALLDDIVSVETLMTTFLKEYELATQKKNF